jgi:hypothetical protein
MSHVSRDAFMTAFPGGDLLLVIPSLNLIVVHIGDALVDGSNKGVFWHTCSTPFIEGAPIPQSDLITSLQFAPKETVIRFGKK